MQAITVLTMAMFSAYGPYSFAAPTAASSKVLVRLFNGMGVGITVVNGSVNATRNYPDPEAVFEAIPAHFPVPANMAGGANERAFIANGLTYCVSLKHVSSGSFLCLAKNGKLYMSVSGSNKDSCVFAKRAAEGSMFYMHNNRMVTSTGNRCYMGVSYLGFPLNCKLVLPPTPEGMWSLLDSENPGQAPKAEESEWYKGELDDPEYYKGVCAKKKCFAKYYELVANSTASPTPAM
ncbi:hypothetical protein [Ranavirus maximus]|uniref:Uncharacterized protein n=1 Tax=Ranavirus maximus TaxID=1887314 RepID=A0A1B2IUB8_FRG3V|nr:hypothetical protein BGV90_gp039 [Ranavirus maximus]ANZ57164.1 hypothetical protein [Ranavirus maximus]